MLGFQLIEPGPWVSAGQSRGRRLCQFQVECSVFLADRRLLAALRESLQPELSHGLQHGEAGFTPWARFLSHQALLAQPFQAGEGIERPIVVADCLRRVERATAGKDGQAAEEDLLLRREQVVTPGDRVA